MSRFREWLRPPRNLLVFFVLIVGLPAATLIALGVRLLDQDRVLARQRQIELLDRAADQAVRLLEQKLLAQRKHLEAETCLADTPDDSICVVFRADRIEALPPDRLPYYPLTRPLKEAAHEPFEELESYEFRQPPDLNRALAFARKLVGSLDPATRAGATLRQGRILRKLGRINEALSAFRDLSRISSVAINGEPADLVARRTRCAILQAQSRLAELREEAAALAADLRAGKWQLDRETFLHVNTNLDAWLGRPDSTAAGIGDEALASAVGWVYEKWKTKSPTETTSGIHLLNGNVPVTILWSFGRARDTAFIAGTRYLKSHWQAEVEKAVHPARAYFAGVGVELPLDVAKVQRRAADTGLPWTLFLAAGEGQPEPPEFAARRRNLAAGLAVLLILITAGSYFILRAVNRELAVARLQSDFVSAVSHEFRTPLTTLRQFNELLAEADGPTPEKRHHFYQAQTRATERLQRLVESLLDFGRMEAGRRPYSLKPLDAAALAHDVRDEFVREVSGLGFSVDYASDSSPHSVAADADALSRALWNLLDNAVKYSGDSRDIELHVSCTNGRVAIAVRDYGIGIPPAEQKRVFQKFVRGAASTSGGIRGTGLGLAMVRHIVEAHGGTVKLESAEGKGSTFAIVLPVRAERGPWERGRLARAGAAGGLQPNADETSALPGRPFP